MTPPYAFDWDQAKRLQWRARNAQVEAAARYFLACSDPRTVAPLSSMDLALRLAGTRDVGKAAPLAKLLSRLGPYMPGLAAHDGEVIVAYGKRRQRWRWFPQGEN